MMVSFAKKKKLKNPHKQMGQIDRDTHAPRLATGSKPALSSHGISCGCEIVKGESSARNRPRQDLLCVSRLSRIGEKTERPPRASHHTRQFSLPPKNTRHLHNVWIKSKTYTELAGLGMKYSLAGFSALKQRARAMNLPKVYLQTNGGHCGPRT